MSGSSNGQSSNGKPSELAPLNPDDPLNELSYALGGGQDSFKIFPGIDGVPHRSKGVRYYKEEDPPHMRPQSGGQVRCDTFVTSSAEEKTRFERTASRVYTMAGQGKAIITHVDRRYDEKASCWRIYMEWVEIYTYDPKSSHFHSEAIPGILRRR